MLIDFINKSYQKGLIRCVAINEGIRVRLRPIILNTVITTLGIPQYSPVWKTICNRTCHRHFIDIIYRPRIMGLSASKTRKTTGEITWIFKYSLNFSNGVQFWA